MNNIHGKKKQWKEFLWPDFLAEGNLLCNLLYIHGKTLNLQTTDSFSYAFWFICCKIY